MLDMNDTGTNTTTSESVVARTASPISAVAALAAASGAIPFSSTKRKMFSSTTIASSMTTPTISTSASIVTLFSVKPSGHMHANVAMTDAGMATPCLLYTSDAADERSSVDLGGRRIIKK